MGEALKIPGPVQPLLRLYAGPRQGVSQHREGAWGSTVGSLRLASC